MESAAASNAACARRDGNKNINSSYITAAVTISELIADCTEVLVSIPHEASFACEIDTDRSFGG